MFVLTGIASLQVIWAVYFAHGTAHLLSLGFSKSSSALTLMAGPLCGVVVQPYIGGLSDTYRCSWGRRRPFIFFGVVGVSLSINLFASLVDAHIYLEGWFQLEPTSSRWIVKLLAVLLVYTLNISVQPVQNGLRALVVETHSAHEQIQVNVWTSYMIAGGNIIGYCMGTGPAISLLSWLAMTEFQMLCILASILLTLTTVVTCLFTTEYNTLLTIEPCPTEHALSPLKHVFQEVQRLPYLISKVCRVQVLAWLAWFTFLYYQTLYVNELYTGGTVNTDSGIKIGSLTGLLFAITSLISSLIISILLCSKTESETEKPARNQRFAETTRMWRFGHIFFAAAMLSTTMIRNWVQATILVALVGIPWSISSIAPYSLIGTELAARRNFEAQEDPESLHRLREQQAGTIMSIHNVAISAPQIIAAAISSGVFWLCYLLGVEDSTVWVLRLGGCAALGAAFML
ncbi:uncharacterized protein ATNIH1004_003726 [Aspergillus tanneri]|uniref:Major facilitator superfamily (MFS) profile domain-containing protein n=1 Tax=Aspergillus tanneri TaxID=1220188 RepID=A0A5M9N1K8_9EURO|nr:uncharacterized protein ATNIH1004_003726 [Aspergillus tanneri]KAA8651033.1 hypothetical protein ATNIH1004_003726 [Aspergillus tanneri]